MGHIHTGEGEHDLTASAFIVRTDFDEPKLMLHLHKKLGVYLQFGGHVEVHEDPWQAITHELLEEAGYEMSQLQLLQPAERLKSLTDATLHPQPVNINTHAIGDNHYHTDIEYAFIADKEPNHKVEAHEKTEIRMFSRAEIASMDASLLWPDTKIICLYILDTCVPNWERVITS